MSANKDQRKIRAVQYIVFILSVLIFGIFIYNIEKVDIIDLSCPFYTLTGLNCPACGATRMVGSILNLDIYQAFRWNPLIFVSIPYYVYVAIALGITYTNTGKISNIHVANSLSVYVIIIFAFAVIRNIPYFSFLAPTKII